MTSDKISSRQASLKGYIQGFESLKDGIEEFSVLRCSPFSLAIKDLGALSRTPNQGDEQKAVIFSQKLHLNTAMQIPHHV